MDMVENGAFDNTKPDVVKGADGGPGALRDTGTAAAPAQSASVSDTTRLVGIPDNSRTPRTLL